MLTLLTFIVAIFLKNVLLVSIRTIAGEDPVFCKT